jgi:hypothetical protein
LTQIAISGLFPAPRPPRQVADFSVGKLVGFLAAPHQAAITISSASHSATQLAALQVVRTTRVPAWPADPAWPTGAAAAPAGPGGPAGPGSPCAPAGPGGPIGPASPFGPSAGFPHAVKTIAKPKTKGSNTIRMEFLIKLGRAPQA